MIFPTDRSGSAGHVAFQRRVNMLRAYSRLNSPKLRAACWNFLRLGLFSALPLLFSLTASTAQAVGVTAASAISVAGQPDQGFGTGTGTSTTLQLASFSGVPGGVQNSTNTQIGAGGTNLAANFFIVDPGLIAKNIRFGSTVANPGDKIYETWNGTTTSIPKPGAFLSIQSANPLAPAAPAAFNPTDSARASWNPAGIPGQAKTTKLGTIALINPGAPKGTMSGSAAIDPYPITAVSGEDDQNSYDTYAYTAYAGGQTITGTDSNSNPTYGPSTLSVDGPNEIAIMEFFADDSNDPTFLTSQSNLIWDFAIILDSSSGTPVLSADFNYDSNRLSVSGSTDPNQMLSSLLTDTADVSYTNNGTSATFNINNPVPLFNGTYTASLNATSVDPNYSDDIDFSYGTSAAAVLLPEPSSLTLMAVTGLLLTTRKPRRIKI
jgi:hypothetical protein